MNVNAYLDFIVVVVDILKNVNAKVTLETLSSSKVRELPTQTADVPYL